MAISLTKDSITGTSLQAYQDYTWNTNTVSTTHQIANVNVFGNRDWDAVFDATVFYGNITSPPWGVVHGRFVCDYADQNGRTYRPRFSSVGDGNSGYGAGVTDFYFQKPDPYNSLATFTIVFSTSLNLQAKLRLSPIHAGISYIQTMYY